MKTIFLIAALASTFIFSFSSCSKCTTCTKSGGSNIKLCEKDYSSHTAYGLAVDYYSGSGYNCN